jgi:hypothetical protein
MIESKYSLLIMGHDLTKAKSIDCQLVSQNIFRLKNKNILKTQENCASRQACRRIFKN